MRAFFLLFIIFISTCSFAQSKSDVELWTGAKANVAPNKRLRFEVQYQLRLHDNLEKRKSQFYQFGVRLKLNKYFYLKPSYRISRYPDINSNRVRFAGNFYFKYKKKFPLRFENRLRFQHVTFSNQAKKENLLRNKVSFSYNLSKLVDPSVSYEIFFSSEGFSNQRAVLGLNWNINKLINLSTFYAYEREMGKKSNDVIHIVGVLGAISIKGKKK